MASIGENLRTVICGSTGVAALFDDVNAEHVVEQGALVQNAPSPRIWYQRTGQETDLDLSGDAGLTESYWDVECYSEDQDESLDVASQVKSKLHGMYGAFGADRVKGVFVEDHDDDYEPKGDASEEGLYVAALSVRILT